MAEFCKQCSISLLGHDTGDFKNMSTKKQTEQGLYTVVLCEGCGPCQVDHTGTCVSVDCLRGHGSGDVVIETELTDGQHVVMSMPEEMFDQLGEHPEVKRRIEEMSKGKPCPVCTKLGLATEGYIFPHFDGTFEVRCSRDACRLRTIRYPTRREAIAAWNRDDVTGG